MRYQKVIRHGNALAVVIPVAVCRVTGIHRGDVVRLVLLHTASSDEQGGHFYLEITPGVEEYPVTETHDNG